MRLLFIVLLACGAFAQEQTETPTFRAGITLVRVDAQVVNRNGRVIPDLTIDDFVVYDENQPQKIVYFGRESEPLDLLLLLDVSGSMHRSLEQMAATARAALRQLHSGDRVAVMLFARRAELREEFTSDFAPVEAEMREAVRDQSLGSGTAIYEAIIAAAGYMTKQPVKARRAILLVTDNLGLNYKVTDDDVIRALYGADTVLNAIIVGKQLHPDQLKPQRPVNPDFTQPDVFKLADSSGGEAVQAGKIGESFQQMIERIRARYSIQYQAPTSAPGMPRRIRVELSPSARRKYHDVIVRARRGYYTAP